MSFNRVILMGNLTRDPQLKYLPSNTPVCEFGVATNRKWRDKDGQQREEVCFVDVAAFGRTGETINQYMTKGRPILIEGRLKYDQWTAQDGGKRSKLSVIAESFSFVGSREGGGGGGAPTGQYESADSGGSAAPPAGGYTQTPASRPPQPARAAPSASEDEPPPNYDNIPF
ncbi:MAG: single-stranded DNA-binding protein [Phycisphaerae bacterium]